MKSGQLKNQKFAWIERLQYLVRNKKAIIGIVLVTIFIITAGVAPLIVSKGALKINITNKLAPPSLEHPFGTDDLGREILYRTLLGSRVSLFIALVSMGISTALGVPIGFVAGYYKGGVDLIIMRLIDTIMSFPPLILALVISSMLGPNLRNAALAIGIVYAPFFARVVRSAVLEVSAEDYVEAAKAFGASDLHILCVVIFRNSLAPLIVQITISTAFAIIMEASLSFLGLGTQPPTPSWGLMLSKSRGFLDLAPWMALFPGLAIAATVVGLNMLGDGLRDIMDPRLRGQT